MHCKRLMSATATVVLALALGDPAGAQAASGASRTYPPVTLERTQSRHLRSAITGTDYELRVRLPEGYDTSTKRYPVVYLLDGDLWFGLTRDIVQGLEWGRHVPELIVVAPAYGDIHGPASGGRNLRDRDYSVIPAQARYEQGGGERFFRFLREELIPYVERELRADTTDRTIIGYSRGADLAIWAMFTSPEVFRRYVLVDNYYAEYLKLEETFASRRKELPAKVFLTSRYPRSGLLEFAERLGSRGYAGLQVEYVDLATARHFAAPGEGISRGLKSVFGKRSTYEALLPLAAAGSVDTVLATYRRIRGTGGDSYELGERELLELGNALVLMRRPADAARIYLLNLEHYPRSAETHSRLGTAYERAGDKAKALESFQAAVRLDPTNRYAADAIARLQR